MSLKKLMSRDLVFGYYSFSLLTLDPLFFYVYRLRRVKDSVARMYVCILVLTLSLSLFIQDRIYWTDLEDEAIYSANRLTGHDVAKVAEHLNNPLDLVVFHEQRQPKGKTCSNNNMTWTFMVLFLFLGQ